jgi:hypothetical protein
MLFKLFMVKLNLRQSAQSAVKKNRDPVQIIKEQPLCRSANSVAKIIYEIENRK